MANEWARVAPALACIGGAAVCWRALSAPVVHSLFSQVKNLAPSSQNRAFSGRAALAFPRAYAALAFPSAPD